METRQQRRARERQGTKTGRSHTSSADYVDFMLSPGMCRARRVMVEEMTTNAVAAGAGKPLTLDEWFAKIDEASAAAAAHRNERNAALVGAVNKVIKPSPDYAMMTRRDHFTADEIEMLGIARWDGLDRLTLTEPLATVVREHLDKNEQQNG